jgi:hypothetical protein
MAMHGQEMELFKMQLASIVKARALAFIELDELNLAGRIRLADFVPLLVSRYDFKTFPTKAEDFDVADKGIAFGSGRWGDIVIDEFKVYNGLMYAETLSSTDDSQKFILDLLEWGAKEHGFTYKQSQIRNWAYISWLTFLTDFPLMESASTPLEKLALKTGEEVSKYWDTSIRYHPLGLSVGHDPLTRKNGIANFTIQRRVNVRVEENRYFSESPLATKTHVQFLEEFESEVKAQKARFESR